MDAGVFAGIALISTVLALGCFWFYFRLRRQRSEASKFGMAAQATVTGRAIEKPKGSDVRYFVTYQFEVEQRTGGLESISRRQAISSQQYQKVNEGSKIPIRYLPTNPQGTALLVGADADTSAGLTLLIMGLILLIPLVFLAALSVVDLIQNAQIASMETADFAAARAALEPRLARWQADQSPGDHDIPATTLGLGYNHISDVDYGYCSDGTFYVYVVYAGSGSQYATYYALEYLVTDAFAYTSRPDDPCAPPNWKVNREPANLDSGWYMSKVDIPLNISTPKPLR